MKLNFKCEGTTEITQVLDSGFLLSKTFNGGTDNVLTDCNSDHFEKESFSDKFNKEYWKKEEFSTDLLSQCKGMMACSPSLNLKSMNDVPESSRRPNLTFFVQVKCSQSAEILKWKNRIGFCISFIGVLIVVLFDIILKLYYKRHTDESFELDAEILTTSDFAASCKIPKESWDYFCKKAKP